MCFSMQYQEGQKRRKPNYSSVDLSEVEWEDKDGIVCGKVHSFKPLCLVEYEPLNVFGSAILSKSVTSLHTV